MEAQKRSGYKDEQIMLDNVEQADDYARFTRCQRWWNKLVSRFTTYHMFIPYLYGVLPHVWSLDLYSYSSLPDEPASLLAEHIAISHYMREITKQADEEWDPNQSV